MSRNFLDPIRLARRAAGAAILVTLASAGAARAEAWRFDVVPYVWATDVGVKATVDGREVVNEFIPVDELMEDIETLFQIRVEATRGAHGVMLDLFYVTLEDEVNGHPLPGGMGTVDLSSELGMTILDLAGTYDPKGDREGIGVVYGVRIIDESASVDADFQIGPTVEREFETEDTFVDGLIGARYRAVFAPHWSARLRADVSTGGTDLTWSAGVGAGYGFGPDDRYGLEAGYRYFFADFEEQDRLDSEMTMSGFGLGFRFSF